MGRGEILTKLTAVFRDELDNERIILTDTTTANDIAEWDSLSHIQLVVAIEKHFRVRFASGEIQRWKNVGEMIDSLCAKIKQNP
ncbi:MAG TPA: acyl carrier protein [Puia sp.]|jgi:acyl carrier protein|nr:acyl carrier protein [Puia sp.]